MKNENYKLQNVSCNISAEHPQKQLFEDVLQNRCFQKGKKEKTCVGISLLIKLHTLDLQHYLKKTIQVFSCEYCDVFRNSIFYRTPLVAASAPGVIQM